VNADLVPVPSQVLERLAAVGVDVARVLQQARLSRSQLAARAHLTTHEFFAFWRVVEEEQGLGGHAAPVWALAADQLPFDDRERQTTIPQTDRDRFSSNPTPETDDVELMEHGAHCSTALARDLLDDRVDPYLRRGALPFQGSTSD
jgi:hypothetical protein